MTFGENYEILGILPKIMTCGNMRTKLTENIQNNFLVGFLFMIKCVITRVKLHTLVHFNPTWAKLARIT